MPGLSTGHRGNTFQRPPGKKKTHFLMQPGFLQQPSSTVHIKERLRSIHLHAQRNDKLGSTMPVVQRKHSGHDFKPSQNSVSLAYSLRRML